MSRNIGKYWSDKDIKYLILLALHTLSLDR